MIRIAQISDLHFGRELPHVVEGLLADLHAFAPTLVAVCGDLTQHATDRQLAAARAFVDQLPEPALVVPGNHDMPAWDLVTRMVSPWRRWRRHFRDPQQLAVVHRPGMVAVGVNTARQWSPTLDWSRGAINESQTLGVESALGSVTHDQLRVIVAHHPFLLTSANQSRGIVGRAAHALERLRHRADLFLGGHIHHGYSGVTSGFVVAQSGTAFSSRLKGEPNGYNRIEGDRAALTVDVMRWDGSAFAVHKRDRYRRLDEEHWVADAH